MAALAAASFVVLFACSWIFVLCEEPQTMKEKPGDNATLQCQSPGGANITVLMWRRSDLKSDDRYVFYLNPDQKNGEYQHPSFRGRVELGDPKMKNGNASVILKNVNINDTGTYECRVRVKNSRRGKRAPVKAELIKTIKLEVTESGGDKEGGDKEGQGEKRADTDGGVQERNVGPMVGLPVFAVLLVAVAVVGTMILKKKQRKNKGKRNTAHPGGENAEEKQLTQENRQAP